MSENETKKIKYKVELNYIEAKTIKYALTKEKAQRKNDNFCIQNETIKEVNNEIIEIIDKIIKYFD